MRVQQYRFELSSKPAATVLRVPVRGTTKRRIADTFGSPRAGGRLHEGLDIFAAAGTPVVSATGDVLGYVGDTGNARGTPPHLHFGIYEMEWAALNPYRLLSTE